MTYNYGYDYTFKPGQQVSVLTLQGRIIVSYQGYEPHVALIHHGATIGAAKLWYDKAHKQFYLLVPLELKVPEPTPDRLPTVVGIDVGQRYLATTATLSNRSRFYPGKRVRAKADHYCKRQGNTRSSSHLGKTAYLYLNTVSSHHPRRFLVGDRLLDQPNEMSRAAKE